MAFKTSAEFILAVTTHANAHQDLRGTGPKFTEFVAIVFFHRRSQRYNTRCDLYTRCRMRGATFKKGKSQANISPPGYRNAVRANYWQSGEH